MVHSIIYNELCNGKIKEESSNSLDSLIPKHCCFINQTQGVFLACTELALLPLKGTKLLRIPIFDSMQLHIQTAVDTIIELENEG